MNTNTKARKTLLLAGIVLAALVIFRVVTSSPEPAAAPVEQGTSPLDELMDGETGTADATQVVSEFNSAMTEAPAWNKFSSSYGEDLVLSGGDRYIVTEAGEGHPVSIAASKADMVDVRHAKVRVNLGNESTTDTLAISTGEWHVERDGAPFPRVSLTFDQGDGGNVELIPGDVVEGELTIDVLGFDPGETFTQDVVDAIKATDGTYHVINTRPSGERIVWAVSVTSEFAPA